MDKPISIADVSDWHRMSELIEAQTPHWPPGSAFGYHAVTFGWLADQLVRRVDVHKRSLAMFVQQELLHGTAFIISIYLLYFH